MICIKFSDRETQDEAVGFLAIRFHVHLFRSGEVIVPERALPVLAAEDFSFNVLGKATDAQVAAMYMGAKQIGPIEVE